MEFFSSPDLWIAFVTLLLLEIVLGIDKRRLHFDPGRQVAG